MIDRSALKALADSYSYQRDRHHRAVSEIDELEGRAKNLRERLSRIRAQEKACYEAFEAAFSCLRVAQYKDRDWHYPHCDSWVLHAPGKCEFCDMCPEAQALRVEHGVCFTGQPRGGQCPCPSELLRGIDTVNRWPGNRPAPKE